jgi:hypothetical protein
MNKIYYSLIISIAVHGSVALFFFKRKNNSQASIPLRVVSRVHIVHSKPIQDSSLPKFQRNSVNTQISQSSGKPSADVPKHRSFGNESKHRPDRLAYKDLLPSLSDGIQYLPQHPQADVEYSGEHKTEINATFNDLVSEISIPLVFRRETDNGRARAKISKAPDGSLVLRELKGDPMLRASLFDILVESDRSSSLLMNLSELFKDELFEIGLEVTTSPEPYSSEFQTSVKVLNNKVMLSIVKHLNFPVFGEGNLPDEHSRRAKRRDKAARSRLIESPAYRESLSNYPIPRK